MNSSRGALLKGISKITFMILQYETCDHIIRVERVSRHSVVFCRIRQIVRLLDFIPLQYYKHFGISSGESGETRPQRSTRANPKESSSINHASTRDPKTGATGDEDERRVDDGVRPRVGGVGIHGVGRFGGGIHGKV